MGKPSLNPYDTYFSHALEFGEATAEGVSHVHEGVEQIIKPAIEPPDSIDIMYGGLGKEYGNSALIRVPVKPSDPQRLDGVIQTGPKKGKKYNVFR